MATCSLLAMLAPQLSESGGQFYLFFCFLHTCSCLWKQIFGSAKIREIIDKTAYERLMLCHSFLVLFSTSN